MNQTPELDPTLVLLLDELRRVDESVWSWDEHGLSLHVLLVESSKIPQAERMKSFGLAGGMGRSLFQPVMINPQARSLCHKLQLINRP
jgi:hypothetical protein